MANQKWVQPNRADPISEPTLNRRVWASYLAAGYTRQSFARAMDVGYNLVANWDAGRFSMSLANFIRASELTRQPMDKLIYGKAGAPPVGVAEPSLGRDERLRIYDELDASDDEIEALESELVAKPTLCGASWCRTWLQVYRAGIAAGKKPDRAASAARTEARATRALVRAAYEARKAIDLQAPVTTQPKARKPRRRLEGIAKMAPTRKTDA